jgi:hypothetical protein
MPAWAAVGLVFLAIGVVTALSQSVKGTQIILMLLSLIGGGAIGASTFKPMELRPEFSGPQLMAVVGCAAVGFLLGLIPGIFWRASLLKNNEHFRQKGIIGAIPPRGKLKVKPVPEPQAKPDPR